MSCVVGNRISKTDANDDNWRCACFLGKSKRSFTVVQIIRTTVRNIYVCVRMKYACVQSGRCFYLRTSFSYRSIAVIRRRCGLFLFIDNVHRIRDSVVNRYDDVTRGSNSFENFCFLQRRSFTKRLPSHAVENIFQEVGRSINPRAPLVFSA